MANTKVNRHERARALSPEGRAFIDGSHVGAVSGAADPATVAG